MCDFRMVPAMNPQAIIEGLKRLSVPHDKIAEAIGRDRTAATKLLSGTRSMKAAEVSILAALLAEAETANDGPDGAATLGDYVPVEVLPTYAGLGGGGTGDGDRESALLPRALVERELRAKPSDLLVINLRGDSMTPIFEHGDQVIIDRRDTNPIQPGPFALWDGDGYVVKNVERNPKTRRYRVFSSNPAYSEHEFDPEEVTIMGRPVWYARRL
jgi:phage repressor protein C with HTH and peptisase S24 domain